MSIAFQCDRCGECHPGEPEHSEDGVDLCRSCVRVLKAFSGIDAFVSMTNYIKRREQNEV